MKALLRLYFTVRPLKKRQLWYLFYYPFKRKFCSRKRVSPASLQAAISRHAISLHSIPTPHCYQPEQQQFCFLNKDKKFEQDIDWNFSEHGALWAFQLNYFEWLEDKQLSPETKRNTLIAYVNSGKKTIGWLPYPTSLRIISWSRFLAQFPNAPENLFVAVAEDASWLSRFPEYQLDGNHLWENGLALLVAGNFLKNALFQQRGEQLLRACIAAQMLNDGGQIEGSPMYQSLMLARLLQGIEIVEQLNNEAGELINFLKESAGKMLSWLQQMTFSDGSWPMVNDSALELAPDTKSLEEYAATLKVFSANLPLSDSGYRLIKNGRFELFVDAAPIQPDYQPGHSHADSGNFCLHVDGKPLIIDLGVSTYEVGSRRRYERSTDAHNVPSFGRNSSDVWKSFRVGKRAKMLAFSEAENSLFLAYAECGGQEVSRQFSWSSDMFCVRDDSKIYSGSQMFGHLHFHPSIRVEKISENQVKIGHYYIEFKDAATIEIFDFEYPAGFHKLIPSQGVKYLARNHSIQFELKLWCP